MTDAVTFEEFCSDPDRQLARVETGESLEVTRNGTAIALLAPPPRYASKLEELVANGTINPNSGTAGLTAGDWDKFTHIEVPDGVDPLAILLEMREDERDLSRLFGVADADCGASQFESPAGFSRGSREREDWRGHHRLGRGCSNM